MKDITNIGDEDLEMKKEELNKILLLLKLNKETLLEDQYNNFEIFNKIKHLAVSKGGFIDFNIRKRLWNYLFYKNKNKKNIIDLIKINEQIKVFISKITLSSQKKELTDSKIKGIKDYNILLNDLPRTCENIIINYTNKKDNKMTSNTSPELFIFACDKFKYQYLQGLLNIIFYFKQIFKSEDCIHALNIFFEFFYKDLIDIKLNQENNDENIGLIHSIITDLYKYLYCKNEENNIIQYIPTLTNKWIISSFISEIKDIYKGYRILDYLIVSEPYIKYVLAATLINKFHDNVSTKYTLNKKLDSLDSSYDEIFNELKNEDLNSIDFDFDEIINDVQSLIEKNGNKIKEFLIEKYGNKFKYTFNENNQGLITYYRNLVSILSIKRPKKEFKLYLGNPKYIKIFVVITSISMIIYYLYNLIDNSRIFW